MKPITPSALAYLREAGREVSYADGATIVHRGSAGEAFYVVLSGTVEVLLEAEDGQRLPLARLAEGATFGEMSLLTTQATSADVVARGDTALLVYPGERFKTALAESSDLRDHILGGFSDSLRQTSAKAWGLYQRSQAMSALMHTQEPTGAIIVESATMRRVQKQIAERAGGDQAVLLTGEPGSGKLFLARKLHEQAAGEGAPLITVDCSRLGEKEAAGVLFGPAEHRRFDQPSRETRALPVSGALDLADRGTLVLEHVESLDMDAQETLWRYFEATKERGDGVVPRAAVIATTCRDLTAAAGEGRFHTGLAEHLRQQTVAVPPLRERRRDILPLAKLFLHEHEGGSETDGYWLNTSAEHALVSARYRHANAAELREAVESATLIAEGREIGSEHIFTGPRDEGGQIEYDLGRNAPVRWLLDKGGLTLLRAGVLLMFLAIAALCLAFRSDWIGRVANGLVWGMWWPGLMLLFLVVGRAWCTVCAISQIGRIARRWVHLDLKPSRWMKEGAPWLMAVLFVAIVWFEHIFAMTHRPFATGILLLSLMAAAIFFCVVYQREVWCRYLCPLGALGGSYSVAGTLQVHANPDVCATQCRTHECFKGSQDIPGCAVFHHPMYAQRAQFCKLCLTCLRSCPHGSARLYLRPPLAGLFRRGGQNDALVPLALVAFFLAPVMLASHKLQWMAGPVPYTAAVVLVIAAALAVQAILRHRSSRNGADAVPVAPLTLALLILGAGPLMAFHVENIPGLADVRIQVPPGTLGAVQSSMLSLPVLAILQWAVILAAAALATVALWSVRSRLTVHGATSRRSGGWPLRVICAGYLAVALALATLAGRS